MKPYNFLCWLILLVSLICIATEAYAESSLTIYIDRNRYMPRYIASEVATQIRNHAPDAPIRGRTLVSPRNRCMEKAKGIDVKDSSLQLRCFEKVSNRKGMKLFITEPLKKDGIQYTAGIANGICRLNDGVAVINCNKENQNGMPRVYWCALAGKHEVGHLRGADHDENKYGGCYSIMSGAALEDVDRCSTLDWSLVSIWEIFQCLR